MNIQPRPTPRSHADPRLAPPPKRMDGGYLTLVLIILLNGVVWIGALCLYFWSITCGMGAAC